MDRTALITGATNGVGRVVAERLGRDGWLVLAHGRDAARGAEIVHAIEQTGGRARFLQADLSALANVRSLAQEVAKDHPPLSLLINNAGVGFGPPDGPREESADGFELRFAVNYLAPFLLTHLLLDNICAAAPARIVNVASIGQGDLDFGDLQLLQNYAGIDAYRKSKLALIMFTLDLADELKGKDVVINALHPATRMDTYMVRESGVAPLSSVEQGADAIMNLAVSASTRGRAGEFFDGLVPARARPQAYDPKAREMLRRMTRELIGAPVML